MSVHKNPDANATYPSLPNIVVIVFLSIKNNKVVIDDDDDVDGADVEDNVDVECFCAVVAALVAEVVVVGAVAG
jgi:hypothetical protein